MAVSVYELAQLKAKFRAFETEENEIKTLKVAAIRFCLFFCVHFGHKSDVLKITVGLAQ